MESSYESKLVLCQGFGIAGSFFLERLWLYKLSSSCLLKEALFLGSILSTTQMYDRYFKVVTLDLPFHHSEEAETSSVHTFFSAPPPPHSPAFSAPSPPQAFPSGERTFSFPFYSSCYYRNNLSGRRKIQHLDVTSNRVWAKQSHG